LTRWLNASAVLLKQLERGGNDVTSAKIILDSLRVSLSLCIHHRHRQHCDAQRSAELELVEKTLETYAWEPIAVFKVFPAWGLTRDLLVEKIRQNLLQLNR